MVVSQHVQCVKHNDIVYVGITGAGQIENMVPDLNLNSSCNVYTPAYAKYLMYTA